ncbi:MAG: class I SAM-dependent methyltransferase [Candidatus Hydrogenedentota bacterium]
MSNVFDTLADTYDGWYDTPEGRAIFDAERDCLRSLFRGPFDSWLEVGVGTGRFARALGIPAGIDPSQEMLKIAQARGIATYSGCAEFLPFSDNAFAGALMALTLCFAADAQQALQECRRVLQPGGRLLLGIVPAESGWGREYTEKAARGHPIYSHAHIRTTEETIALARRAGFTLCGTAGTLFWKPGQAPGQAPRIASPCGAEAGFLALLFQQPGAGRAPAIGNI